MQRYALLSRTIFPDGKAGRWTSLDGSTVTRVTSWPTLASKHQEEDKQLIARFGGDEAAANNSLADLLNDTSDLLTLMGDPSLFSPEEERRRGEAPPHLAAGGTWALVPLMKRGWRGSEEKWCDLAQSGFVRVARMKEDTHRSYSTCR